MSKKTQEPERLCDVPGGDYVSLHDGDYVVRFHIGDTAALSPRTDPCGEIIMRTGQTRLMRYEARNRNPMASGGASLDPLGGIG